MKSENDNIVRKLTRARTQLLLGQPFFGTLCLRLKLMAAPVATMATDGRRIAYEPSFVQLLTPAELEGVIAHEVMHCALGHHCRRGTRDPKLWNIAADFAINPLLIANGFTLPSDALLDPEFENLSAEEIYARLLQRDDGQNGPSGQSQSAGSGSGAGSPSPGSQSQTPPQPADSGGSQPQQPAAIAGNGGAQCEPPQPGGFGQVLDATDEDGAPASEAGTRRQQHEWAIAAEQALRSSKTCGREPLAVERNLQESSQSKQDWRSALRDFVAARTPADYSWTPPNRRHVYAGLYLPSVVREGIGKIVIAVDTSGSIGDEELAQFAGEITAIADEAQPEGIHVVYCDAAVQSTQEFVASEPVLLEPKGGGGTDFCPAFEWVEQNGIEPVCLIYLTDLLCNSFPEPPSYPVLWVTDSRGTAPFGDTIQITVD